MAPPAGALLSCQMSASAAPVAFEQDAELVHLAQQWRAACTALDEECDALVAAEDGMSWQDMQRAEQPMLAYMQIIAGIEDAIAGTSASGATGLAVKAALLARIYLGPALALDRHYLLARTLAADARRLVPCAAGVEA